MTKEIPRTIYLQTGCAADNGEAKGPEMDDEMTWCQDSIYAHDTRYVRADLIANWLAESAMSERITKKRCDELLTLVGRRDNGNG